MVFQENVHVDENNENNENMKEITNFLDEYDNYIKQFQNLHFTMEQLDEDKYFQKIIKEIISNNRLLQEAFKKFPEFKNAFNDHFDNNRQLKNYKEFVHAPSPISSFLTCLIMCRYH